MNRIGIDIGGSSARAGLVREGRIVARETIPTGYDLEPRPFLDALTAAIRRLSGAPDFIGVGMPGLQDSAGRVKDASNLPALNGIAVSAELSAPWGCPHRMDNDLNVLALSEALYGAEALYGVEAPKPSRILTVALGTGIGAAMTVDGVVLRPTSGSLGDPGHVLVDPEGALCRCGAHGCLETKVAGWAVTKLDDIPYWLGVGLATYCVLYEPDCIVLGGKISTTGGEAFGAAVAARLQSICQPRFRAVPVRISILGDDAGILGAASLK